MYQRLGNMLRALIMHWDYRVRGFSEGPQGNLMFMTAKANHTAEYQT